jgi:UDPglucose 6-dehydrogenase
MLKIGFFGLSHLGLCYAAAFLKKGFKIIAVDKNQNLINDLNNKKLPIYERGLDIIFKKKILFSSNVHDLNESDFIFYSKDVITDEQNISNYNLIKTDINELDSIINKKKPLIVLSQVYPGFLRSLKVKRDLFYKVETLIFGQAIERALYPERIIIGKKNYNSTISKELISCFRKFTKNLIITNYETAELAKISINLFLISSIMTSNSIAQYCEKINANWEVIKKSLSLDKRIGECAYLNPSPGLSGGNLERDLKNAARLFSPNDLYQTWINIDKKMTNWTLDVLKKQIKKKAKLLIVGSVYKKGTNSLKNSYSLNLLKNISKLYNIRMYEENMNLFRKFTVFKNLNKFNKNEKIKFDAIIFVNDWYKPNKKNYLNYLNSKTKVIDPYGYFSKDKLIINYAYFSIGHFRL